jgi:hypothetical protein
MPIRPETRWPPSSGQGCDSAPCGTANNMAAVEPIDSTMIGDAVGPSTRRLVQYTAKMATKPPSADTRRSRWLTGLSSMPSSFSQEKEGFVGDMWAPVGCGSLPRFQPRNLHAPRIPGA